MTAKLPVRGFKWRSSLSLAEILAYSNDDKKGYLVEGRIRIPRELHDKLNCLPPAPMHCDITEKEASETSLEIRRKRGPPEADDQPTKRQKLEFSSRKLCSDLHEKKMIFHVATLQCYLNLGAELLSVHRVLEFEQVANFHLN